MHPPKWSPESVAGGDEGAEVDIKKLKRECTELEPRSYQLAIFEVAVKRNTIAVLDTGAGKTMISVMLIKHICNEIKGPDRNTDGRRLIIFLAPTVVLVHQQYEEIKSQINIEVEKYYGMKGVDTWTAEIWKREISLHQVMVMTPQILLDALRMAFINLKTIRLLILDECHNATGNHPYTRIMKEFYHSAIRKPSIFGMTASPVVRKGVASSIDCEDQLKQLEMLLDAQICTLTDRRELDKIVPSAKQVNRYYDTNPNRFEGLRENLQQLLSLYDREIEILQRENPVQYKDANEIIKDSRKSLSAYLDRIFVCLNECGLICARQATKISLESNRISQDTDSSVITAANALCNKFLEAVLVGIEECLLDGYEELLVSESGCREALDLGYFSPKVYELIQILRSFGESSQIRCLIFVERIITAKVVERLMRTISFLSHFRFSYLTGGGSSSAEALSSKMQKETLESFRSGKVNMLFTTDVAEEGLNVADCSCVVRFDLPKTVRSYVQSCGRVRQDNSEFFIMLERGNLQQRDLLFDILRSKYSMIDTAMKRDAMDASPPSRLRTGFEVEEFCVESTGAKVTSASSISLIHGYCTKLPKDKFYNPRPNLVVEQLSSGLFECTLTLPTNAAFQTLVGPAETNSHRAKQRVCLEACKKLHQMGALDDYLCPCTEVPALEGDESDKDLGKKATAGEGTSKRKELHGTTSVRALSGTWAHVKAGVRLQGYRFDFVCNLPEIKYSSFVLLIDTILDEDVGSLDLGLYLVEKMVKATISPCGLIELDEEQVEKAKRFQELFFNGLFGRVIVGKKSANESKKFLLNENAEISLWSSAKMYFLLPIDSGCKETVQIYWRGINSTVSAVQFFKNVYSTPDGDFSKVEENREEGKICLANESVEIGNLKDAVVMAVHTGKIYCVLEVLNDWSAESPFDGVSEKSDSQFQTFTEYFNKKYNISLKHSNQPMLLLKHSHNAHNLLSAHAIEEGASEKKKHKKCAPTKKPEAHAHMPPELLVRIDVPVDIYKSFYLLPSVVHRIESLMLASQLRAEVGYNSRHIPSSLILQALTTLRSSEDFSFERLELLGDSVLKYTVSCHLFLKYLDKHEGQLTSRRCQLICNATLHRLGIRQNIQTYIRDEAFEPRRWLAPGQITIHPSPCNCMLDDSEGLDKYFFDDDAKNSLIIGKTCDKGHRWMCSKTVSDCVEALIGAYYIGGGLDAAIALLKWLGIDTAITADLISNAINAASMWNYLPKIHEIETVEEKIGYKFGVKGLLLEAITHPSQQELGISYCYQRLEFLGDAVLDILITRHLYNTHTDVDPGELTDLRSASVNNETFAQCAVKHNLYQHLQHGSQFLLEQINDYIKGLKESLDGSDPSKTPPKGPKVLGDIVESIAGAMLIDTKFDLNKTWEIFEWLLSPLVTPESLELPPWRELIELCCHHGYFLESSCEKTKNDMITAAVQVQLENVRIVRSATDKMKKEAKGKAAFLLLKDLEKRGLLHSRYGSHAKQPDGMSNGKALCENSQISCMDLGVPALPDSDNCVPVSINVSIKKGGPRSALFELCKKKQWPMPTFDFTELKQSLGAKGGPSTFIAAINLCIPFLGAIKVQGEGRLDKKSSQDSAAMSMLYELQKQRRCEIHETL